jgi:hypothetical protein
MNTCCVFIESDSSDIKEKHAGFYYLIIQHSKVWLHAFGDLNLAPLYGKLK